MKSKEKAKELFDKYLPLSDDGGYYDDMSYNNGEDKEKNAKQCALIAVEEIISNRQQIHMKNKYYWQEVKKEIEKL